jgi:hypothetical protein
VDAVGAAVVQVAEGGVAAVGDHRAGESAHSFAIAALFV